MEGHKMTVITKTYSPLAVSSYVGLLSYGKEIGMNAAQLGVGHPDNYIQRSAVGLDMVATLCSLLEVKAPSKLLAETGEVFVTNHTVKPGVEGLLTKLGEAIDEYFDALTPEDDFEGHKPATVKRAITSARNTINKILELRGHLVLFHAIYLDAQDAAGDDSYNPVAMFVNAILDEEEASDWYNPPKMLVAVKKIHTTLKAWDRANIKVVKGLDFVEVEFED